MAELIFLGIKISIALAGFTGVSKGLEFYILGKQGGRKDDNHSLH